MGFEEYKTIIVMIGCQFIYSGMILSVRAALLEHMSSRVFVVYRQCIAFLLIAPIAFFSRRGTKRCRLNWRSFWLMFVLSFVGLEKVRVKSLRGSAKIIGTTICVSGAAAMALFKGAKLLNMEFLQRNSLFLQSAHGYDQPWLIGCLLLFGGVCSLALWLILQVPLNGCYPDHLSSTAWICLMAAMQSGIWAMITHPNMNQWKLTSKLQLFACFYAGMTSAITFFAQAWCIARKGPLFTAMFQPLSTVIITVLACIFMHEELYTGSMIGGLAVIIGLYIVLWGKAKDIKEVKENTTSYTTEASSDSCKIDLEDPLLSENLPAT